MGNVKVRKMPSENRLPDQRVVSTVVTNRGLDMLGRGKRAFTQAELLEQVRGMDTSHATIMDVRELDIALLECDAAWSSKMDCTGPDLEISVWRSRLFGVYARGFGAELDKPVGREPVWYEDGVPHVFRIPDVIHPTEDKALHQASGVVVFHVDDLVLDTDDAEKRVVRVRDDFDPSTHFLRVVNIHRYDSSVSDPSSSAFASVDDDGIPILENRVSGVADIIRFRYCRVGSDDDFEYDSTAWMGSFTRGFGPGNVPEFGAFTKWSEPRGIAVVSVATNLRE